MRLYAIASDCPIFDRMFEYCQMYTGGSVGGAVSVVPMCGVCKRQSDADGDQHGGTLRVCVPMCPGNNASYPSHVDGILMESP